MSLLPAAGHTAAGARGVVGDQVKENVDKQQNTPSAPWHRRMDGITAGDGSADVVARTSTLTEPKPREAVTSHTRD
jgi:hypothetical protein